jgi:uncharacterized membrane protein
MLLLILAEQCYYLFLSIFVQTCLFHHLHLYFVMASSSLLSWQQQQYYNLHNILLACIYSIIFYLIVKMKTHFFQQPFYNINDDDVVASGEADVNGIFIKEEDDFWCQIKTFQQKNKSISFLRMLKFLIAHFKMFIVFWWHFRIKLNFIFQLLLLPHAFFC